MKKLFLSFIILSVAGFAQIKSFDSTQVEAVKKDLWGTYKEIIKENLTLKEDEAKIFWPLLDEYIADYSKKFDQRVANTEEYMMNYYGMDDETARGLINKGIQLEADIISMKKVYAEKMLDQLPAVVVGKFLQLDTRISALANLIRLSSVPLVREQE
jgi:hypothetical protein